MTNILLTLILFCFLSFFVVIFVAYRKIRSIETELRDFVTPASEGQPSKLATVAEAISEMIGRSVVAAVKTTLMGMKSGEARAETAIQGEILDASPLGGLANLLPKSIKKSLIKNPQLLDMAMGYLANRSNGNNHGSRTALSPGDSPKFNL